MNQFQNRLWQTPPRLSPAWARIVAALAIVVLPIAASGFWLYDGLTRVAHVSALGLVELTNLVWTIGSMLPENEVGKTPRGVTAAQYPHAHRAHMVGADPR